MRALKLAHTPGQPCEFRGVTARPRGAGSPSRIADGVVPRTVCFADGGGRGCPSGFGRPETVSGPHEIFAMLANIIYYIDSNMDSPGWWDLSHIIWPYRTYFWGPG